MKEVILEVPYIPSSILPAKFEIKDVEERFGIYQSGKKKGETYLYHRLLLQPLDKLGGPYEYIAKFDDEAFLGNTLTSKPESWFGRTVGVMIGEKGFYQFF